MSRKVTVIGAGSVGATIAYTLTATGGASEIVLIDINEAKCQGEAMDIQQGISFCQPATVRAGSYEDARGSDIVILTSGIARKPGQTRLELAQTNVNITKSIIPLITAAAPDAIYLIVSNPVDILTYLFVRQSGIPEHHIIGSGTSLDTARLKTCLADYYHINQSNVHACVYGEHGDTSFVPWSHATIANIPVDQYGDSLLTRDDTPRPPVHDEVERYIRESGGKIIERKGATFYAIALSTANICKCIFTGVETSLTISSMMHGEYGIDDVCLSTLCVVGRDGIVNKILLPLTPEEEALLRKSADKLKETLRSLAM